uniref:DUF6950 domain-containing protein n=1 Tax=viral metagenome TaxID=1070528 RepID=A0A6M3K0V1_9ZZZZ
MRRPDWELRLVEYANGIQGALFSWGETDCFALARGAAGAILEDNPLADVPTYISQAEATGVAAAFRGIPGQLARRGAVRHPIEFGQQGDIVTMPGRDGAHLPQFGFIVDGRGRAMTSAPETGVEIVPIETLPRGAAAWRF